MMTTLCFFAGAVSSWAGRAPGKNAIRTGRRLRRFLIGWMRE
jgi:hypothetical protein